MAVRTYSPEDIELSIALVHRVTGYSDGQSIALSKDGEVFGTTKGASGHIERVHSPDKTYTLELTLAQTSPTNAVLNGLYTVDDTSRLGMFPMFMKDTSGQSVFTSPTCWIESLPTASYSGSMETRVWTIKCANTVFGIAGNDSEAQAIEDAGRLASLITQYASNLGVF